VVRSGLASRFDTAALPELPITALTEEDATRLLDARHPGLRPQTRRTVLDQADGNPLALVELGSQLAGQAGAEEATAADPFGRPGLPLPRRLQNLYGARIAALSDTVRAELLMAALDGTGAGAGAGDGADPGTNTRYRMPDGDVDEAVAAGLLEAEPATGELVFRHPLIRSSVMQMATPNQRRSAHRALAEVHRNSLERHASHLAAATVDPDEEVAAVLEAAADSATRRGGALAAVAWLTRAAELSEDPGVRARRLGDAAFVAGHAARLGQAHRLLSAAPVSVSGGGSASTSASTVTSASSSGGAGSAGLPALQSSPAAVLASAYQSLYQHGDVRLTHRQVVAAIERLRAGDPAESEADLPRLVMLLLAISQYAGDRVLWDSSHALLEKVGGPIAERSKLFGSAWSDVVRHGAGWTETVEQAAANLGDLPPWEISRLGVAAYHLDLLSHFRPHLQRVVDRELETGALATGMVMLHLIMLDQMAAGEWDAAESTGQRGLKLAVEHQHALFAAQSRAYLAQLAAMRGQVGTARDLQAEVDAWARPRGLGFLTQIADSAGTIAAMSAGDYETAYLYAIGITPPGTFRPYAYQASRTLLDLVEAARHTGRAEQARAHALAARDAGLPEISPRLALITYGALAMTAESEAEAAEMCALAESLPDAARFPFELARIRLAHGIRVRHRQGRVPAQRFLVAAAEAFDRLGAAGWAERARAEVRAAGAPAGVSLLNLASLTWQERRIADLAAGGLTNKEIGKRLHLSPRTVSSHLYRIFPKLGISTRAALRDALSRAEETPLAKEAAAV
jgi:DNA-binding CsgD family transcriptional regulator